MQDLFKYPYSPDTLPENFRPSELALVYTDHGRRTEFVLRKMLKTLCFDRKIPVLLFCDDFEKELLLEEVERLPVREVCERAKKNVSENPIEIIFVYADLAYMEDTVGSSCDCNLNEINDKIEIVSKGMMSYRLNTLKP